jgi:hypothetical protein
MTLIIKIIFLFNQMIVEIDTHKIDCIKLNKKIYLARLHSLKILFKNKYFYS